MEEDKPKKSILKKNSLESSKVDVKGDFHIGDVYHVSSEKLASTEDVTAGDEKLKKIQRLVADNKTGEAIQLLESVMSNASAQQKDQILLLRQRWNAVLSDDNMGIRSWDEISRRKLQIANTVLRLGREVLA